MTLTQQIATLKHHVRLNDFGLFLSDLRNILTDIQEIPDEILQAISTAELDLPTYIDDLKMELENELEDEFNTKEEEIREEMRGEFAEALEAMAEDYK